MQNLFGYGGESLVKNGVLAAGVDPAYMSCVYQSFRDLTDGKDLRADEVFDNFEAITGRKPLTLADFAAKHSAAFKY